MNRLRPTIVRLLKVDGKGELLEAKILKRLSHPAVVDLIEVLNNKHARVLNNSSQNVRTSSYQQQIQSQQQLRSNSQQQFYIRLFSVLPQNHHTGVFLKQPPPIFFQVFSSRSYFLLVMAFCLGDQLWSLVHCNPGGLPEPISCILFKQVLIYDDTRKYINILNSI